MLWSWINGVYLRHALATCKNDVSSIGLHSKAYTSTFQRGLWYQVATHEGKQHLAYRCVWHTGWPNKHQTKFHNANGRFVIDFLKIINYNQISRFVYIFQFPLSCCGYPVSKLCCSKFKVNPRSGLAWTHDWILFLRPAPSLMWRESYANVSAGAMLRKLELRPNRISTDRYVPSNGMHPVGDIRLEESVFHGCRSVKSDRQPWHKRALTWENPFQSRGQWIYGTLIECDKSCITGVTHSVYMSRHISMSVCRVHTRSAFSVEAMKKNRYQCYLYEFEFDWLKESVLFMSPFNDPKYIHTNVIQTNGCGGYSVQRHI